jgi:hypothetical protein
MPFFPDKYKAYPIAENITPKNAMIGRVATLGMENNETPHR